MKTVLVVDDHVALVNSSANALKQAGYEVTKCFNGGDALHKLKVSKFDFLVTDHFMPVKTGLELVEYVIEQKLQTAVILISSHHQNIQLQSRNVLTSDSLQKHQQAFQKVLDYPRGLVVVKPFLSSELLQKLRELEERVAALPAAPAAT